MADTAPMKRLRRITSSTTRPQFIHIIFEDGPTVWVNIREVEHIIIKERGVIFPEVLSRFISPKGCDSVTNYMMSERADYPKNGDRDRANAFLLIGFLEQFGLLDDDYPVTGVPIIVNSVVHYSACGDFDDFVKVADHYYLDWKQHWEYVLTEEKNKKRKREESSEVESTVPLKKSAKVDEKDEDEEIFCVPQREVSPVNYDGSYADFMRFCDGDFEDTREIAFTLLNNVNVKLGYSPCTVDPHSPEFIEFVQEFFEEIRDRMTKEYEKKKKEKEESPVPLAQEVPISPVKIEDEGSISEEF